MAWYPLFLSFFLAVCLLRGRALCVPCALCTLIHSPTERTQWHVLGSERPTSFHAVLLFNFFFFFFSFLYSPCPTAIPGPAVAVALFLLLLTWRNFPPGEERKKSRSKNDYDFLVFSLATCCPTRTRHALLSLYFFLSLVYSSEYFYSKLCTLCSTTTKASISWGRGKSKFSQALERREEKRGGGRTSEWTSEWVDEKRKKHTYTHNPQSTGRWEMHLERFNRKLTQPVFSPSFLPSSLSFSFSLCLIQCPLVLQPRETTGRRLIAPFARPDWSHCHTLATKFTPSEGKRKGQEKNKPLFCFLAFFFAHFYFFSPVEFVCCRPLHLGL